MLRGGRIVSSTRIRALIAEGELAMANDFLGHPFRLVERVIHGDRRGRTLGFPTANLPILPGVAMLPNGAYAVRVAYDGQWYGGMASIGSNPTFAGCSRRVEVNIADFSADIYDRASSASPQRSSSCGSSRRTARVRPPSGARSCHRNKLNAQTSTLWTLCARPCSKSSQSRCACGLRSWGFI